MTAYEQIENKLRTDMIEGQMHVCLRDAGRLAGGFRATGALSQADIDSLEAVATMLSRNPKEAKSKWREAVEYGRRDPIKKDTRKPHEYGHFGFEDTVEICSMNPKKPKHEDPETDSDRIIDEHWIEADDIPDPAQDWETADSIRYLEALFLPEERVGIVLDAWEKDGGKLIPQKGFCGLTREALCDGLRKGGWSEGGLNLTLHPTAGAWVRINPLDGQGVKDLNVTAFRHSLIEADDQDLGKQLALIRKLQLPCSAVVHSGGKSIHAIVRVDASDIEQYRARVNRLYEVCSKNGLKVDSANRNPSRLSRLPGIARGDRPQYLIAGPSGQPSWADWEKFIEEESDDLPEIEKLSAVWDNLPPLAPELIQGILREGHKLRLTGPSKAGKSWSLIELVIAIAEGRSWMGMQCRQGAVMYVNMELDRPSALHRFAQVYKALGWKPSFLSFIDVWNLRGKSLPLDKLAPRLIRRAQGRRLKAIVFDPIYKLSWGDENDAGDVAQFCNKLDHIATELGCAVIDAHHHSKGVQGQKRSIDRGSGSGVFGRDPDACLDLIELEIKAKRREVLEWCLFEKALRHFADENGLDLGKVEAGTTSARNLDAFVLASQAAFPSKGVEIADMAFQTRQRAPTLSGWRLEATLREFATPAPLHIWFDWPIHPIDDTGILQDAKAEGEEPPWMADQEARDEARRKKAAEAGQAITEAVEVLGGPGKPACSVQGVADHLGCDVDTVRNRLKKHPMYGFKRGMIVAREQDEDSDEG